MTHGRCTPLRHFIGHGLPSLPIYRSATDVEPFRPLDMNDRQHQGAIPRGLADVSTNLRHHQSQPTPYSQDLLHPNTGPRGSTRP